MESDECHGDGVGILWGLVIAIAIWSVSLWFALQWLAVA
jgi:tetrahydromethanopterin S-methyltransferase subunit G